MCQGRTWSQDIKLLTLQIRWEFQHLCLLLEFQHPGQTLPIPPIRSQNLAGLMATAQDEPPRLGPGGGGGAARQGRGLGGAGPEEGSQFKFFLNEFCVTHQ